MSSYPDSRRIELDYGTDSRATFNFFNAVYAWMCVGLVVTALVAWFVSQSQTMTAMIYSSRGVVLAMALGAFGIAWYVHRSSCESALRLRRRCSSSTPSSSA